MDRSGHHQLFTTLRRGSGIRPATPGFARSRLHGTDLDISLSGLPFEKHCIARATPWHFEDGSHLLTCSAEDLVVHKAFANRPQDWVDISGIIARQGPALNETQILQELRPLTELKEQPEILSHLGKMLSDSSKK